MKIVFIFFFLILSCGKRDLENQLENPFFGKWKLEKVSCYINDFDLLEEYIMPMSTEITFEYIKGDFIYTLQSSGSAGFCNLENAGTYSFSANSFQSGRLNLYTSEVAPNMCDLFIQDRISEVIVPIPLYWQEPEKKELQWSFNLQDDRMVMSPYNFTGATTTPQGCAGNCLCIGYWEEI